MSRADRRRQAKEDEKRLIHGIDPESSDPGAVAAMARLLHGLFETAKREKSIDPPVKFFLAKIDATLQAKSGVALACAKGCSHCCHACVSATAPEVLFLAKLIRRRGESGAFARVQAAHLATKDYDIAARAKHPHPCPLLEADLCSVYPSRPMTCRLAASADAMACARALRQSLGGTIPTPMCHLRARGVYEMTMVTALLHAGLPHRYYELNDALNRALLVEDAERAWLGGEDVFAGVRLDPNDTLSSPSTQRLYRHAFG
jgi:Putative zinc- or iron-chelating domain